MADVNNFIIHLSLNRFCGHVSVMIVLKIISELLILKL